MAISIPPTTIIIIIIILLLLLLPTVPSTVDKINVTGTSDVAVGREKKATTAKGNGQAAVGQSDLEEEEEDGRGGGRRVVCKRHVATGGEKVASLFAKALKGVGDREKGTIVTVLQAQKRRERDGRERQQRRTEEVKAAASGSMPWEKGCDLTLSLSLSLYPLPKTGIHRMGSSSK
ncbi:hypothetical protein C4D60_Mb10t27090 [Musa balbisiana]|uniref:Uncharacterized protein n=1 Tax=Musa balbisiana TaxID=52838 RepID=A0A4S8J1L0_MUSBA|nr:hypothetical protein C4D60_Mb10t27090 [Musa balbisiana]